MTIKGIIKLAKKRDDKILEILREYDPSIKTISEVNLKRLFKYDNATKDEELSAIIRRYKTLFLAIKNYYFQRFLESDHGYNMEYLECLSKSAIEANFNPLSAQT